MTPKIKKSLAALEAAEDAAATCIFEEIDKEARARGIDSIQLLTWEDKLCRNGKDVQNKKIRDLLDLYCSEINDKGVLAFWTAEDGWI